MEDQLMDILTQYWPLLVPIVLLEIGLLAFALLDLLKPGRVTRGPRWMWIVIIALVNIIGPIIYFMVGRQESAHDEYAGLE